jgi:hypothetical protein
VGLLYLSLDSRRILLILENEKWTVPTFSLQKSVMEDSEDLQNKFSRGKILPIELYLSKDRGFEYGTYICLVKDEFITKTVPTFCWCDLNYLPKNVHAGLKSTLNNNLIRTKIQTVLELEDAINI